MIDDTLVVQYRRGWRVRVVGTKGWSFRPIPDRPDAAELLAPNGGRTVVQMELLTGRAEPPFPHTVLCNLADILVMARYGDATARILGESDWNNWTRNDY